MPRTSIPSRTIETLISQACTEAIELNKDAWILSALTDRSFEEGTRSRDFGESCASMRSARIDPKLVTDIEHGINGRLEASIRAIDPALVVNRNPSRVPDLDVFAPGGLRRMAMESKQVYDLTLSKYYPKVGEDRDKLLALGSSIPGVGLYQIVWFIQLPAFDYPAGRWYGHKDCPGRTSYLVRSGIESQYAAVRSMLGESTWPDNGPLVVSLEDLADAPVAKAAKRWMKQIFVPSFGWKFEPKKHLRGAAVGVAVWKHSK